MGHVLGCKEDVLTPLLVLNSVLYQQLHGHFTVHQILKQVGCRALSYNKLCIMVGSTIIYIL